MNLRGHINQLADCKPTNIPFINLYLDTQNKEQNKGNYLHFLSDKREYIFMDYLMDGGNKELFEKCWHRIHHFLKNDLKSTSNGVVIILRLDTKESIFIVHELPVPIKNSVIVDGVPNIYPLIQLINENIIS